MSSPAPADGPDRAAQVLAIIKFLTVSERERLFKLLEYRPSLFNGTNYVIVPEALTELMLRIIRSFLRELAPELSRKVANLRARLAKRNRRSATKTVRRNVEICKLRNDKPKFWTLGRLAKQFKVTKRAISKVLAEEIKWNWLAAELDKGTN
jgi:hypothetical protein